MCTITKNASFNSFELSFDGKPSEEVRNLLKANGYRWNGKRGIWYGYKDIAELLNGEQITLDTAEAATPASVQDDKQQQKQLIERYAKLYGRNNAKSVDYMRSAVAYVIELDNGTLYAIEKPRIKTNFCFRRDYNGLYSEETEKEADDMAEYASTQESYFLDKNLTPLVVELKKFDIALISQDDDYHLQRYKHKKPYSRNMYCGTEGISAVEFVDDFEDDRNTAIKNGYSPLSDNDIKNIITGLNIVIEQFKKRLSAYLKRYGLEKLNVWTYYSD